tara:strand:- start:9032 stop:9580 length:549 start_codon:yes stop_codon:yes gene_type:complete
VTEQPLFILGKKISLRALSEADASGPYLEWFNDAKVCAGNSHHVFPYTQIQASYYIQQVTEMPKNLVLAIEENSSKKHIGNVSLQAIHNIHLSAEFSIILGDKNCWGKGYGNEVATLILTHGFNELNLQRIYCGTPEYNTGMIKLAKKLGMTEEGKRRKAFFKSGSYHDILEFGILKDEFIK